MPTDVLIDPTSGQIYWNDGTGSPESIAIKGDAINTISFTGYSASFSPGSTPAGALTLVTIKDSAGTDALIPGTTGYNLGSSTLRWNTFSSNANLSGTLVVSDSTGTTSLLTGSARFNGGIAISGGASIGQTLFLFNGANYTAFVSSASGNTVYTLPATSPATGSSVLQSTSAGVLSWVPLAASSASGGTVYNGTVAQLAFYGATGNTVGGASGVTYNPTSGLFYITHTTPSFSTTTGALIVAGGVGIGGSIFTAPTSKSSISGVSFNNSRAENGFTVNTTGGYSFNIQDGANNQRLNYHGDTNKTHFSGNTAAHEIRFFHSNESAYTGFRANSSGTVTYTWPAGDGSNGQYLQTNGTGTLSWTTVSGGSGGGSSGVNAGGQYQIGYYASTGASIDGSSTFTNNTSTGVIAIGHATASTNSGNGALTVFGGVGIGGSLYVGGIGASITGVTFSNSTITRGTWNGTAISPTYGGTGLNNSSATGLLQYSSGTASVITTSAALASIISDKTGTAGKLVFSTSPVFTTDVTTDSGSFNVFNTTATTINAFGAATTLSVGAATGKFTHNSTDNSSSISTGSLVVLGGAGIAKSVSIGGYLQLFNSTNFTAFVSSASGNTLYTLPATSPATGSSVLQSTSAGVMSWVPMVASSSGAGSGTVAIPDAQYRLAFYAGTGASVSSTNLITAVGTGVTILGATNASSTTVAALSILGGLGVTGNAFIGGTTNITSSQASISSSSGALVVTGGVGIGGSLFTPSSNASSISGVVLLNNSVTASTINKVTITAPASSATLTLVDGSTLITSGANSLTLTTTATTNSTFPAGTKTLVATDVTSLASLNTVGVITSGTWAGTVITSLYGGTGFNSYTIGDILVASTGTSLAKLPAGSTNFVLTSNGTGTVPSWQAVPSSSASSVAVTPTTLNQSFFITAISSSNGSGLGLSTITTFVINPNSGIVSLSGLAVTSGLNASSTTSAAFNVLGGLGITGNAFIGGTTNITSSAVSIGTNSGALVVTGGVGIGGSLYTSAGSTSSVSGVLLANNTVSASTYNKVAITVPATLATLTLSNNSSLITSGGHSLTFTTTNTTNVTVPTTGTLATTSNKLSDFAATTSLELLNTITGETGSGALVFATSPDFTTSVTTSSATFSVFNATATNISAFGAATTLSIGAASGKATINSVDNSTSTTTGAFVVTGGAAVGQSLSIAGRLQMFNGATNYTAFLSSASTPVTYTLPPTAPAGVGSSYLSASTAGVMAWVAAPTSGGGSPGGTNLGDIQYKSGSSFAAATTFNYDDNIGQLSISSFPLSAVTSTSAALKILGTSQSWNGSSLGSFLVMNAAVGFVGDLIHAQVNGVSRLQLSGDGYLRLGAVGTGFTLPILNGTSGQVLTANTNGVASWTTVTGSSGAGSGTVAIPGAQYQVAAYYHSATGASVSGSTTFTNNTSTGVVNITHVTESTTSTTGALTVSGGAGIAKSLFVGTTLSVGQAPGYNVTNNLASFVSTVNTYNQVVIQNKSNGTQASADFVLNNDISTDTANYGNFGMNSSTFSGSGALGATNAVYLTATSGPLVFGTTTQHPIRFVVNGGTTDVMYIAESGTAISVFTNLDLRTQNDIRFFNSGNTFYTGIQAANNTANYTLSLPTAPVGAGASLLITGSDSNMYFVAPGAGIAFSNAVTNVPAIRAKRSLNLQFSSGFTPLAAGADNVVIRVPESPTDGATVLTYILARFQVRVETPSAGSSRLQLERSSTDTGAFTLAASGSSHIGGFGVTITGAGIYLTSVTSFAGSFVTSGNLLRLNWTQLNATHANFGVILTIEEV